MLVNDDTLFGLALKYGVSLEAIKTANPGLNPNFLTVGKPVVIPIQATPASTSVPAPTPVPVRMAAPRCYPTADGGLWCFVLANNDLLFGLENLSAWIRLEDSNGQVLAEQAAIPPLNRLPSGAALPLMAFFSPPVTAVAAPSAELANSLVIAAGDTRYLHSYRADPVSGYSAGRAAGRSTGGCAPASWLAPGERGMGGGSSL